jgi:pimeloyl-ACP methyl ester carboxylesterase
MVGVHHRYAAVRGWQVFYREAGPEDAPAIVLLHGFPTGSFMFRNLIPQLADHYHVIAPDLLGYGFSDSPTVEEFDYSFDALAEITAELLEQIGLQRYAIYVQDYGAPIGWRLALRDRAAVTAIVTQNGNGYDEGFIAKAWQPIWNYQHEQSPHNEAALRQALTLDAVRAQYVTGVSDPSLISPDTWHYDYTQLSRPGNDQVQLQMFRDYATNPPIYPELHAWLRERQTPVLAVWGKSDPFFGPDGARAFAHDTPNAEIHLLDGGHFLLETACDTVAELITDFLNRRLGSESTQAGRTQTNAQTLLRTALTSCAADDDERHH